MAKIWESAHAKQKQESEEDAENLCSKVSVFLEYQCQSLSRNKEKINEVITEMGYDNIKRGILKIYKKTELIQLINDWRKCFPDEKKYPSFDELKRTISHVKPLDFWKILEDSNYKGITIKITSGIFVFSESKIIDLSTLDPLDALAFLNVSEEAIIIELYIQTKIKICTII
jgi:hypothetical protein